MLTITVGFVFTQVMFYDDQGKLQFHRALTDVDKPWITVLEVLQLLKSALLVDAPKNVQPYFQTLNVRVDYKTVDFDRLLASMHEALSAAYVQSEIHLENWEPPRESLVESTMSNETAPICPEENEDVPMRQLSIVDGGDIEIQTALGQLIAQPIFGDFANEIEIDLLKEKKQAIIAKRMNSRDETRVSCLARGDPSPLIPCA